MFCAVLTKIFVNLVESDAGFGFTRQDAIEDLLKQTGFDYD